MSLASGQRALREEAVAILACADRLGDSFVAAVDLLLNCPGRVITCGVGKSGHIARKTAGTLASTGTPSLFLHAAEAVHGDLGMVTPGDVVILYSHSGETDEIVRLFPALDAIGASTILVTGRPDSSAGRAAKLVLDTGVTTEACPIKLAPTTSTTVMLALSDALAITVMDRRGFTPDDFARNHPAGALGRQLLLRVSDVMRKDEYLALVQPSTSFMDTLRAITQAGTGAACVVDDHNEMKGFISDGDLRRRLLSDPVALQSTASEVMSTQFSTLPPEMMAIEALEVFQNHPKKIGELPVVKDGQVVGLLVLKDLLRSGIV